MSAALVAAAAAQGGRLHTSQLSPRTTGRIERMTQVLLAGGNTLLIDGLRALFESEPDFRVVAATDVAHAGYIAARVGAEVVVADLFVQALDGPALIAQVRKQAPDDAKIVVLSTSPDPVYVSKVMAAGASAYALKSESFGGLLGAIRAAVSGFRYLSPQLDARAVEEYQRKQGEPRSDSFKTLTVRERQVLQLAAEGRTGAQIAAQLGISRRTAETHRANIYRKLLVDSQTDLIALALRRGLLPAGTSD